VRRVDECDQPRPKLLNLPVGVGEPLAQVVVVLAESLRLGAKSSAIGEQVVRRALAAAMLFMGPASAFAECTCVLYGRCEAGPIEGTVEVLDK
jgi:hypothetical protein